VDITKNFEKRLQAKNIKAAQTLIEKNKDLDQMSLSKLEDIYKKEHEQKQEEKTSDIYTKVLIEGVQ
jgi:hypothetical protein